MLVRGSKLSAVLSYKEKKGVHCGETQQTCIFSLQVSAAHSSVHIHGPTTSNNCATYEYTSSHQPKMMGKLQQQRGCTRCGLQGPDHRHTCTQSQRFLKQHAIWNVLRPDSSKPEQRGLSKKVVRGRPKGEASQRHHPLCHDAGQTSRRACIPT